MIAACVSISVIGLWVWSVKSSSQVVAYMGAVYAVLCSAFFCAQLFAFVKAHMSYDRSIENPKFDLLKVEEEEWGLN